MASSPNRPRAARRGECARLRPSRHRDRGQGELSPERARRSSPRLAPGPARRPLRPRHRPAYGPRPLRARGPPERRTRGGPLGVTRAASTSSGRAMAMASGSTWSGSRSRARSCFRPLTRSRSTRRRGSGPERGDHTQRPPVATRLAPGIEPAGGARTGALTRRRLRPTAHLRPMHPQRGAGRAAAGPCRCVGWRRAMPALAEEC
jgi:hypothetical protein